ncbi:MAG: ABC transporter permease [Armatimonadetes bacterium]|nr:FtsX-like permease family protein [Armatimonadota bacterium]MBS1701327.1 ABC transporter permease [Armatimonadota bacterium]
MSLLQSVLVALDMLRLHKLRAFLTMFGVIIGVMAVTMTVMISNGFQSYMTNQFSKIGAKTITIMFDPGFRQRGQSMGKFDGLKTDDLQYLRDRCSSLDIISPSVMVPAQKATFEDKTLDSPRVYGGSIQSFKLNGTELESGRFYTQEEVDDRANVAVIGIDVKTQLFGSNPAEGQLITLAGITVEVIGVAKKQTIFGQSNGKDIYIPYTSAQSKWVGGNKLNYIQATPKDGVKPDVAMDDIWKALMLKSGNKKIYRVDSAESILGVFNSLIASAGLLLSAIAALSLLVGGIGIMNIMLVSVTERTREIGLRKALGAKRSLILLQFIVESATLALVGGLIGMGIAYGFGTVVTLATQQMKWPNESGLATPFPLSAAVGAMMFSAFIGVIFGFYPALSASRLDPIVALRRE